MKLEEKIKKKRWTKSEINQTLNILRSAEKQKTPLIKFFDTIVYGVALLIAIIGNFIVSVVIVPILIALTGFPLYFTLFFVGISFGALLYTVIKMVEAINPKKNLIAGLIIASLALINIYMITNLTNKLELQMGLTKFHDPILVSIAYAGGYILPYIFFLIKEQINHRKTLNTYS
ncbi:hypothetical protein GF358_03955 [Candidatus Woesearchaeota archaeon]|nr:hypothetical protein [Candidatus Woesearchaeota archaeon]